MPYSDYFLPESPEADPNSPASNIIVRGFGGGFLILKGYYPAASSPTVYATLSGAVLARFRSSPDLVSLVPGGFWYKEVPNSARATLPYGQYTDVSESISEDWKGPAYYTQYWQASFFGARGDEAKMRLIVEAWYAAFGPNAPALHWSGRSMIRFSNSGTRSMDDDGDAPGGEGGSTTPLIQTIIEFLVISQPSSSA